MATSGHEARERPEITKSLVDEWIGWSSIPANPALIERLIRWKRYPYAPYEVLR